MQTEPARELQGVRRVAPGVRHPAWKTVFSGSYKDPNDALGFLRGLSVDVSPAAIRLIELVCQGPRGSGQTKLVLKTVSELGFKSGEEFAKVAEAWTAEGLTYCPKDTAIMLSPEYTTLPVGEVIKVMSVPIEMGRLSCIFVIRREPRQVSLDAIKFEEDGWLMPDERLILAKYDDLVRDN
jgi:hypothetical protein